ncbi:MAG: HigA family addiction module antidote protein [Ignavibacteriae bacterium]|nr:HigA family addiction module antidote protein [Ignavibacteriota bacterium]
MAETRLYKYEPDYVVRPGEVLEENLETRGIKKVDLAQRCGLSTKTISQILNGSAPVSPETALCFQRVLGVSANVWNNLEANYRLFLARQKVREDLVQWDDWTKRFPTKELAERGLIDPKSVIVETTEQLLDFFGVGSVQAWDAKYGVLQVAFRCSPSFKSSRESVSAWLRIGEICADKVNCTSYSKTKLMTSLSKIRGLTAEDPSVFEPIMRRLCAEAGVALVFVSELPGTHLSGATRWMSKDKALIMLSLRRKRDDHFWFSFFHEAGHILFGGKKNIFLDEMNSWTDPEEELANDFASYTLIPRDRYREFLERGEYTITSVRRFAEKQGIAPGIVVGRLQHEGIIPWNALNGLTRKFELVEACN